MNDFSGDSHCMALWRFEPGALTADSKGSNTLTARNAPTSNATYNQEGAGCAACVSGSDQGFGIPASSLPAGFPLLPADTVKKISFSYWIKIPTLYPGHIHAGFWHSDGASKSILFTSTWNSGEYKVYWYSAGGSEQRFDVVTLTADHQYHISIIADGVNKTLKVRIWDATTSSWAFDGTYSPSSELQVPSGSVFNIIAGPLNCYVDEFVVFDDLLTNAETEAIRDGTYPLTPSNEVRVSSVTASVEWVPTDPNVHRYAGNIPLAIIPQGTTHPVWSKVGSIPIAVTTDTEYYYQVPGTYEYHGRIAFSISPDAHVARGFPFASPGIPVTITPEAAFLCPNRFFVSPGIPIEITPASFYRTPVAGVDDDSGYGAADLSFLDGPPPYYVIMGDMKLSLSPLATSCSLYAEALQETSGGVVVGGALGFSDSYPDEARLTTTGGVKVGGRLELADVEPGITRFGLGGGVEVRGGCSFAFVDDVDIPETRVTTSRGVNVGGALAFEFVGLAELVTLITLDGGVVVGGLRRAPVTFVTPTVDDTVTEFETRGTIFAGGSLEIDTPDPGVYAFELSRAQVVVGGALTFGFWEPSVLELELSGGVIVEGTALEEEAARFETWALNGFYFEPSMYGNFPFNSYAEKNGQFFAAGDDGIYLLEGSDDAGRPIHPGVRIGPTNFGYSNDKRLRAIYPGKDGTPTMRLVGRGGAESFCKRDDRGRFSVSQKVQDDIMTVEISDFEKLSHIQFVPVHLNKR